jgi:hypothetical protein
MAAIATPCYRWGGGRAVCTTTTKPDGVRAYTPSPPSRTVSLGGVVSRAGRYASSTAPPSPSPSSSAYCDEQVADRDMTHVV